MELLDSDRNRSTQPQVLKREVVPVLNTEVSVLSQETCGIGSPLIHIAVT